MDVISQREMRNASGEVLRRVKAGESIVVANHGVPVAMLVPASSRADGQVGPAAVITPARRPLDPVAWTVYDVDGPSVTETVDRLKGDR